MRKFTLVFSLLCISSLLAKEDKPAVPTCPRFLGESPDRLIGGDLTVAFDSFRSLPDGSWAGNTGALVAGNFAVAIPKDKYGFGAQLGGSYGIYDWDGRWSNATGNTKALQQEAFLTVGLFRRVPDCSGWNAGLVYDVMFNKQASVFAVTSFIGQMRGQLGYLIKGGNEVGAWATVNALTWHETVDSTPVTFRAICQVNLFWSHYFENLAQTTLWVGTPYRRGLMYTSGRPGQYIVGASFRAPLTQELSVVGHGAYMGAHSGSVQQTSRNYAADVCIGLSYSFGGCKAGGRPYLPVGDNSNFLVDTNANM